MTSTLERPLELTLILIFPSTRPGTLRADNNGLLDQSTTTQHTFSLPLDKLPSLIKTLLNSRVELPELSHGPLVLSSKTDQTWITLADQRSQETSSLLSTKNVMLRKTSMMRKRLALQNLQVLPSLPLPWARLYSCLWLSVSHEFHLNTISN